MVAHVCVALDISLAQGEQNPTCPKNYKRLSSSINDIRYPLGQKRP